MESNLGANELVNVEDRVLDPITSGVVAGLIVEGLKEVVRLGRYIKRHGSGTFLEEESLHQALESDASLSSILSHSTKLLSFSEESTNIERRS